MRESIELMGVARHYAAHKEEFKKVIESVCDESAFCDGKFVHEFEKSFAEFSGVVNASAVNSGTSALFLTMKSLGIGEGDEVIVPSATFVSSAWGIVYCGATPVFADCRNDTWELDAESAAEKITSKTKAILCVHLYGQPCDMGKLKALADKHGLFLIEDCAQANGAKWNGKRVGTFGNAGCFSFYPTKNLGAFGEGGCVISDDKKVTDKISFLKKHASSTNGDHSEVGYNMRMEGIQAAVLNYKLKMLDKANRKRIEIAEKYSSLIHNDKLVKQVINENAECVYHLYVLSVSDRNNFIDYMKNNGIECGVHYRMPCHLMSVFSSLGYKKGSLPNCEYLFEHCVSIPIYPELTDEETDRIIDACNKY